AHAMIPVMVQRRRKMRGRVTLDAGLAAQTTGPAVQKVGIVLIRRIYNGGDDADFDEAELFLGHGTGLTRDRQPHGVDTVFSVGVNGVAFRAGRAVAELPEPREGAGDAGRISELHGQGTAPTIAIRN